MDRDDAIARIRAALRARSGKEWSVTGGRGTAWGWITITTPPRRRVDAEGHAIGEPNGRGGIVGPDDVHYMSPVERAELGALLGLANPSHFQGESVPASGDYREEYVARAEGRTPTVFGHPYWD